MDDGSKREIISQKARRKGASLFTSPSLLNQNVKLTSSDAPRPCLRCGTCENF